jgi:hypothetical protein
MEILILIAGAAVIAMGWLHHIHARRRTARSDGVAPGVVTASEVVRRIETTADHELQDVYYAKPSYTYEVEGKTLTGTRIRFGSEQRYADRRKAEAALAGYPAGATILVRYNPRKPSECALESASPSLVPPLLATAAGIALALVGTSLALGR